MYADRFEVCIARVRHRFATSLESKIRTAMAATEHMTRSDAGAVQYVTHSYRNLHSIFGVGASVGFAATGDAARDAETALIQAYEEKRGLTEDEVSSLKSALARLQDVAGSELRSMYERGG
jgi:HPt (histidine-containing phosphotransfer) domain-containing protein